MKASSRPLFAAAVVLALALSLVAAAADGDAPFDPTDASVVAIERTFGDRRRRAPPQPMHR